MNGSILKKIMKTKTFLGLFVAMLCYFIGFFIFLNWIEPNRGTENYWTSFYDIIYMIYWRWYLDWAMIAGFLIVFLFCAILVSIFQKKFSYQIISTYILPVTIMLANYIGMLAIDIAVTYFADYFINGTWLSPQILFANLNAQKLYHGFFFWFMPALLIIGLPLMKLIHLKHDRYRNTVKTLFFLMGLYSLSLGCLDPVVCKYIWGSWSIFGEWNMMNQGGMWATGWITHYILFMILWFFGIWCIEKIYHEITTKF